LFSFNSSCAHCTVIKKIKMRVKVQRNQAVANYAVGREAPEELEDPELEVMEIADHLEDGEVLEDPGLEVISISSDSDEDPELEVMEINDNLEDGEVLEDPGLEVIVISSDSDEDVPRPAWAGVPMPPMVAWPAWAGIEPSIGEYWFNEWMHYRVTFGETYYNEWFASHVVTAGDFENYDWMAYYNNE
jgi:hypothetical protein